MWLSLAGDGRMDIQTMKIMYVPPDTSKVPAELFLYFEKVAEWEEKV